jgi:hypothetical protein
MFDSYKKYNLKGYIRILREPKIIKRIYIKSIENEVGVL